MLKIITLSGQAITPYLPQIAALRIEVFNEFPYLYEGTLEYEQHYLLRYINSEKSIVVLIADDEKIVGASTALPLADEVHDFQQPFLQCHFDIQKIFYFGESVLQKNYRGLGLGKRFFEERERHARTVGKFDYLAFCAVDRPANHPRRPLDYRPLNSFWQQQGFVFHPELHTTFIWKECDENQESPKPMSFWLKTIV